MSDIRFNGWLHRSGSGGVYQDSSGRVGIGTSTQNHSLVLYQADSGTHDCISMRNSTTVNNGFTLGVSSVEDAFLWNGSNTNMTFATNNSERLRITSAGNVSIHSGAYGGGGTAPQLYVVGTGGRQVKIHNTSDATSSIQITNSATGQGDDAGTQLFTQGTTGDFWIQSQFATADLVFATKASGASSTEKLRIASDGRVSMGNDLSVSGICTAATFIPAQGQLSNRRLNINGAMQVAQRATSKATQDGTEGVQALDRWYILYSNSASGACTLSQDTDVPTDYTWGRFANSQKVDVTTANASPSSNHGITLQYRFEGQDIANNGWDYTNTNSKLSVSFWAKSVKAGTYCVFLYTQDGTSKIIRTEYTLVANTWKHIELEFAGDSGISFGDDNGGSLYVGWVLLVGSDREGTNATWEAAGSPQEYGTANQVNFFDNTANNFWLTGVQIEVGKATKFEHRSYGEELSLCQRYYYKITGSSDQIAFGYGRTNGTTSVEANIPLPVPLRASPSLTCAGNSAWAGADNSSSTTAPTVRLWDANRSDISLVFSGHSSLTNARGANVFCSSGSNLELSAEI